MQWRVRSDLSMGNVLGHILLWFVLTLVTCGIAAFWYPYSFVAAIVNSMYLIDQHDRPFARLHCASSPGADFLHGLGWFFISLVTLGIGAFFYLYYVARTIVARTTLLPIAAAQPAYALPAVTG
ncbi:MAG TPA: DUF6693 family protein [Polyangiaceae bacterium]|jgi:hypothetical protein|nr:DUF6693 family protein [Polyangiaceae bacterium]